MQIIITKQVVQAAAGAETCFEQDALLPQSSICLQSGFVELEFPLEQALCQYYS